MNGDECPDCAAWQASGAHFCPRCGRALNPVPRPPSKYPILHGFALATAVIFLVLAVCELLSLLLQLGGLLEACNQIRYSIGVYIGTLDWRILRVSGLGLQIILVAAIAVEAFCLLFALRRFLEGIQRGKRTGSDDPSERNGLTATAGALSVSLFLGIGLLLLAAALGSAADSSWMDDYTHEQLSVMLCLAGVFEELEDRVVLIGIPLMLIALLYRRDRRAWQYLLGGCGMNRTAAVLIAVSALLFGLSHLNGWGWGKVPDAVLGGLLFGYIYVQYGLYASILMHTVNDLISVAGWFLFGTAGAVLFEFALLGLGLIILVYWIVKPRRDVVDLRHMATFPAKCTEGVLAWWKRAQ